MEVGGVGRVGGGICVAAAECDRLGSACSELINPGVLTVGWLPLSEVSGHFRLAAMSQNAVSARYGQHKDLKEARSRLPLMESITVVGAVSGDALRHIASLGQAATDIAPAGVLAGLIVTWATRRTGLAPSLTTLAWIPIGAVWISRIAIGWFVWLAYVTFAASLTGESWLRHRRDRDPVDNADAEHMVAIEVELTSKTHTRLRAILCGYMRNQRLSVVRYYAPPRVAGLGERVAAAVAAHEIIQLYDIASAP